MENHNIESLSKKLLVLINTQLHTGPCDGFRKAHGGDTLHHQHGIDDVGLRIDSWSVDWIDDFLSFGPQDMIFFAQKTTPSQVTQCLIYSHRLELVDPQIKS